ncbi:fluoride efflux transporter CrcB [Acetobacter oeni]|uniref:Fluoride-specific ion channel FluC n=1 Tax=Acetobacter oeni TaxID=304077 RepID=A0A511XKG9_9PROT|nr:fluoride efflux transporter CrcB [Acetobacter oeni]MBB3881364.1 CrcB protein [Acetobacter oeni]NHO18232.1 fluoride efflux transporter CrcB [Acetobacter oeni]GBR11228.1 integral membrane protein CrcB [Acetobacter oeni LMG 21952]GEN63443.1 putative fluoride ion transporter CrcB [Acetobacter oeni]
MFANSLPPILIALGGAAGTLLRYWIGMATARWSHSLPWGTIFINMTGSFVIALFAGLTAAGGRLQISDTGRLVFMVGLCGGYTTFSSFSLQTLDLLRNGTPGRALLNITLSIVLCMASVSAGYLAAQTINHAQIRESK